MDAPPQQEEQPDEEDFLFPDSRPLLLPGVKVINIPADYQEVVRRLRHKSSLHDVPGHPVKIAIRRPPSGPVEVRQLSPLTVELLGFCTRNLTVDEITAEFQQRKLGIPGISPDKACLVGIEILRQQPLIAIA